MEDLELDRMEIEEAGDRPELLVAELHRQLGDIGPPIPVHRIARALGIVEVRSEPLTSFEGCLVTNPARSDGAILVNGRSSWQRQRFTVGHELGHYLCTWHVAQDPQIFRCTKSDMIRTAVRNGDPDQEVEANCFAIELLAPPRFLRPFRTLSPDLDHVVELAGRLDISREAAARRYAELHRRPVAMVFCRSGTSRWVYRPDGFPWIPFDKGDTIPELPGPSIGQATSEVVEADQRDWLRGAPSGEVGLQVLWQQDGYQIVMLTFDREE